MSHNTVAAVRREMEATGQIDQLEKTTGKDGKARPAKNRSLHDLIHRPPDDPGPEPVEQTALITGTASYDPADELTIEEMQADPVAYWQDLTWDADERLHDAHRKYQIACMKRDRAAVVQALDELIAAATEIKNTVPS